MTEPTIGSLCTGYGGLDEAVISVFGGRLVWCSDIEPGPIAVMDRHHPAPNLGDVKTMPWAAVPRVDILTAGYPCQPFSNAGKRKGVDDPRHLWPYIARGIGALRPRLVVLENVAAHLRRGFDVVLADLATLGYDATWTIVRASDAGAPHRRERLFVLAVDAAADTAGVGLEPHQSEHDPATSARRGFTAQDTDGATGAQRWPAASGQAQGGRPRPDAGGRSVISPADPARDGRNQRGATRAGKLRRSQSADGSGDAPTDANGQGSQRSGAAGSATGLRRRPIHQDRSSVSNPARWGDYAGAIARWEDVLGREAPEPTTTGARGARVLSPRFVEWMMGLPAGYVIGTPGLSRNQMLTLLGNGVVIQQAELAIRTLLPLLEVS